MTETRDGIFAGDDPFEIISRWYTDAQEAELNDPNAVALATVDKDGLPNVRVVLVKDFEPDAIVFYTNYESAKGQELIQAGKAAVNFHWKSLRRQIRMRGLIEIEDGAQADDYYTSRPLGSRIGAWASRQSRPLESREALRARAAQLEGELGADPQRPPFWGGFRLRPIEIECWADGEFRLHDRFRWVRKTVSDPWSVTRLNP